MNEEEERVLAGIIADIKAELLQAVYGLLEGGPAEPEFRENELYVEYEDKRFRVVLEETED